MQTKIREFLSERNGKRRVTFTIIMDDGEEVVYPEVLLPNEVDAVAKSLDYERNAIEHMKLREKDRAFSWADKGLNPANYPFKYNIKREILAEMYDKTLPEEMQIASKLSILQNLKNRLATFLGFNN